MNRIATAVQRSGFGAYITVCDPGGDVSGQAKHYLQVDRIHVLDGLL